MAVYSRVFVHLRLVIEPQVKQNLKLLDPEAVCEKCDRIPGHLITLSCVNPIRNPVYAPAEYEVACGYPAIMKKSWLVFAND